MTVKRKSVIAKKLVALVVSVILMLSGNHFVLAEDIVIERDPLAKKEELMFNPSIQLPFKAEIIEDEKGMRLFGTLTQFPEETMLVRPLYSLTQSGELITIHNGNSNETYDWDLQFLDAKETEQQMLLQTQLCGDTNVEFMKAFQSGSLNKFWVALMIETKSGSCYYTERVEIQKSQMPSLENSPAFEAEVFVDKEGYGIMGTLKDIPLDGVQIRPMYSTDNKEYAEEEYYDWQLPEENSEEEIIAGLQKQLCARGNSEVFSEYLKGEIDSFYVKLRINTSKGNCYDTEPAFITRTIELPLLEEPLDFQTEINFTEAGILLYGTFSDFTTDIKSIRPIYSIDDTNYEYIVDQNDGETNDWDLTVGTNGKDDTRFVKQICSYPLQEPFSSYLSEKLEQFYVKLRITTWSGKEYETKASLVSRGDFLLQPKETSVVGNYPAVMKVREGRPPKFTFYGKYQITVREGTTKEELLSMLPKKLPIDVQLMKADEYGILKIMDQGIFHYDVQWQIPDNLSLTQTDNPIIIKNATKDFNIPAGQQISMLRGKYILTDPIEFDLRYSSKEVRLYINVIPKEEKAQIGLRNTPPLSIVFDKKPTNAAAIRYFYYIDGMEQWVEKGELTAKNPVDYQPLNAAYGDIPLFHVNETPWNEYSSGKINYFLIGVEIEGGIYDGERHILKWPDDYELPGKIPSFNGSGGNENNAGSGDKEEEEEDGLYPGIPEEDKPPVQIPPLEEGKEEEEVVKPELPDDSKEKPDNSFENVNGWEDIQPILPDMKDNIFETNEPQLPSISTDLKEETNELEQFPKNTQSDSESEKIKISANKKEENKETERVNSVAMGNNSGGKKERSKTDRLEASFYPIRESDNFTKKQTEQLKKKKDKIVISEEDTTDFTKNKESVKEQKEEYTQNIVEKERKENKETSKRVGLQIKVEVIVFMLCIAATIIGICITRQNTKIKAIIKKFFTHS